MLTLNNNKFFYVLTKHVKLHHSTMIITRHLKSIKSYKFLYKNYVVVEHVQHDLELRLWGQIIKKL
jgi:hypothetical protein